MQRDRAFGSYEDTEARYERRPSAWVRPLGDWGPGRVELLQLHTPDETHDNIVAYWVPARLPAPGRAAGLRLRAGLAGRRAAAPAGRLGGAVAPRLRLRAPRAGGRAGRAGAVRRRFRRPGAGRAAGRRAGAGRRHRRRQRPHRTGPQPSSTPPPAAGAWPCGCAPSTPSQPVELRAFLRHRDDIVSETWTHIVLPPSAP